MHIKVFLQPCSFKIQRLQKEITKPGDPESKKIKYQKQRFFVVVVVLIGFFPKKKG